MKLQKIVLFALALLLLLALNFAAVYGYFYRFVFDIPAEPDIAGIEGYQDAVALSINEKHADTGLNRYILVRTAAGETRLLALQGSLYFKDRYHYLPDRALSIPDERPYSVTARTMNESVLITIDAENRVALHESAAVWPAPLDMLYTYLPMILLVAEILIGVMIHRAQKKKKAS